ncbi:MAG TPA: NAD(P)/FAD-dependent oxidoreductase [Actinomycetota bacterium]|nr:NAD(P)/FAD-dependent oxidoreductase [Actinomycetota bacterium]
MSTSMDVADAIVIGSGPNGLVAAITLARKGWDVTVLERNPTPGGAVASAPLTEPGYIHDPFSAFYGLLHSTPVFRELHLANRIAWAQFDTPVGAGLDPNTGAFIHRDLRATADGLGEDGEAWLEMYTWWQRIGTRFFDAMLAPIPPIRAGLRFARAAKIRGSIDAARMMITPVGEVARQSFSTLGAQMAFACGDSHTDLSVDQAGSTPMALILAMLAQQYGMPVPVGGAGKLSEGLVGLLEEAGGTLHCAEPVTKVVVERGRARAVETERGRIVRARHAILADTGPRALFHSLVGDENLPARFLDGLRTFRYGTGMFKVDLALDAPAPWLVEQARSCGVYHLVGTLDTMARAAYEGAHGLLPAEPLLIVGQQSLADPSRAPKGGHTLWIETHVPPSPRGDGGSRSKIDGWDGAREPFLERVLSRLEQHAPGVREHIVGTHVRTPSDLQEADPNLVGGDVGGGTSAIDHQLIFRPVPGWFRYRTPVKGLYLCSASAHPGGGVHGMAGRNAAARALKDSHRPRGVLATAGGARRTPSR